MGSARKPALMVDTAINLYLDTIKCAKTTIKTYQRSLRPLRRLQKRLDRVTVHDLREIYDQIEGQTARYVNHPSRPQLDGGLSLGTRNKIGREWRAFFNWCVDEELLMISPARRLEFPSVTELVPKEADQFDIDRMLETARLKSTRDYVLLCLIADTAIREGAAVQIELTDINWSTLHILVHEKGSKVLIVKMSPRTADAIRAYLQERPTNAGPKLFISRRGKPLTTSGVYQVFKRLANEAGITGRYNPHAFRHSFAIYALEHGADIKAVQQLLGHSNIEVTAKYYARYQRAALDAIHDRVTPLRPERTGDEPCDNA